jgi:MarR family 2-MHQ and catechol resistance regulon transcriptional repressor
VTGLDEAQAATAGRVVRDPLAAQAFGWLHRAANAATTAHAEELRPHGLSPSAFNVLLALSQTPDGTLEPCQLAERLLVTRPSVTGLLDTLQTKRLIERRPHHEDRRRVLVALTREGRALLHSTFAAHLRCQRELFAGLSQDELATLVLLLRRVKGAMPGI